MISWDAFTTLDEHIIVSATFSKLENHGANPAIANDNGRAVLFDIKFHLAQQEVHVFCRRSRVRVDLRDHNTSSGHSGYVPWTVNDVR